MKKNYIISLTILAIVQFSYAQIPEYSLPLDDNMHYVVDMLPTSSGNFVIVAQHNSSCFIVVSSVSPAGEILWSRNYPGKIAGNARLTQKSDGNILIPMGNYYPQLLEINQLGDSIRSFTLTENENSFFGSAIELPDSKIIVTENIYNNDPLWYSVIASRFIKLGPEMNILEIYTEQPFDYRDMIPLTDSSLVTMTFAFNQSINAIILQYTHEFQQLAGATCPELDPDLMKLVRLNDDFLAAYGSDNSTSDNNAILAKVSQAGDMIFCKNYPGYSFSSVTKDETSETMYALGYDNGQYHVYTISYSGSLISTHPISDTLEANNIYYHDNFLYITAGFNSYINPRSCFIKMHRDSVLSINDKQNLSVFKVYPNPANNQVVFEFRDQIPEFVKEGNQNAIQITNLIGQELACLPLNEERIVWDCGIVKPGIYFYSYKLSGKSFSGKIVVSR